MIPESFNGVTATFYPLDNNKASIGNINLKSNINENKPLNITFDNNTKFVGQIFDGFIDYSVALSYNILFNQNEKNTVEVVQ